MIKIIKEPSNEEKRGYYLSFLFTCKYIYQRYVKISDDESEHEYAFTEKEAEKVYKLCKDINRRLDGGQWGVSLRNIENLCKWYRDESPDRDIKYERGRWYYDWLKGVDKCDDDEISIIVETYEKIRKTEYPDKVWADDKTIRVDIGEVF